MNLAALVVANARSRPDGRAFLLDDGAQTWAATAERIARIAGALRARGAARGSRVALLARNSSHFLEGLLACAWSGAVAVPLNWRLSPGEIAFQIADTEPVLVVRDIALDPLLAEARGDWPVLSTESDLEAFATGAERIAVPEPLDDDAVFGIFYTGGTTGLPKGVMLTHGNLHANTANVRQLIAYTAADVHLHAAPMFHLADLGYTFVGLEAGCAHVFLAAFTPVAALEAIARHRVTITLLAPAMITAIVREPRLAAFDCSSLARITYGGAPIPEETLKRALDTLRCDLYQGFGQTEATHTVTTLTAADHRAIADHSALALSCGRPAPGIEVMIQDPQGNPADRGQPGEVCARGRTIMKGYWRRERETADALAGGWLHMGDIGVMDAAGYLTLLDRKKDMIVSGAENVYSVEVENALSTHPAVLEAAVIGVPDAVWGERVHAIVVLAPARAVTAEDLREHARKAIGGYKVPKTIDFVERLPRSATGKILKEVLRAPYWQGQRRNIG